MKAVKDNIQFSGILTVWIIVLLTLKKTTEEGKQTWLKLKLKK